MSLNLVESTETGRDNFLLLLLDDFSSINFFPLFVVKWYLFRSSNLQSIETSLTWRTKKKSARSSNKRKLMEFRDFLFKLIFVCLIFSVFVQCNDKFILLHLISFYIVCIYQKPLLQFFSMRKWCSFFEMKFLLSNNLWFYWFRIWIQNEDPKSLILTLLWILFYVCRTLNQFVFYKNDWILK